MRGTVSVFVLLFVLASCQPDTPSGNEIVFADVIGNYEGECADFTSSTSELMNREDATLSIVAATINSAGIKTSCNRIKDQNLSVKSATAAEIVFEESIDNSIVTMTYIAIYDSIVIIQTMDGITENLIFSGKRN